MARAPAPTPPSVSTPVAETVIGVRTSELDSFGHVNHAVYLTYFEHARFEALAEAGFSWGVLAERGWAIFVVRIEVDYLAEARREDRLLVRTWADSFRRTSMVLAQEMVRADDPDVAVARARVTAVWIGPDRKAMRVPEEVRAGLTGGRVGQPQPDSQPRPVGQPQPDSQPRPDGLPQPHSRAQPDGQPHSDSRPHHASHPQSGESPA